MRAMQMDGATSQLNHKFLDPAVNHIFEKMKSELSSQKKKCQDALENASALNFNPDRYKVWLCIEFQMFRWDDFLNQISFFYFCINSHLLFNHTFCYATVNWAKDWWQNVDSWVKRTESWVRRCRGLKTKWRWSDKWSEKPEHIN